MIRIILISCLLFSRFLESLISQLTSKISSFRWYHITSKHQGVHKIIGASIYRNQQKPLCANSDVTATFPYGFSEYVNFAKTWLKNWILVITIAVICDFSIFVFLMVTNRKTFFLSFALYSPSPRPSDLPSYRISGLSRNCGYRYEQGFSLSQSSLIPCVIISHK